MGRKIFSIVFAVFFMIISGGCSKPKGEFAFKKFTQDQYKRMHDPLEFEKSERINWVYIFKDVREVHNIGLGLLKKEIVWVDINSRVEQISEYNNAIYGKIENLSDGVYKIILSLENKVIDEREFVIYSDSEDYYN
ncbi:MAG: hypothetical protein JXN64_10740 [Spirochaetes bacterium]|nr:hypothetical protein [Spirochaetota bacterium]